MIRYRRLKLVIPMIITSIVESVALLGVAAIIGWNLDLAAIAGIIIAVGTGVNSQIVITDEFLNKEKVEDTSLKEKMKRAFFIIMGSYFTVVVAMIPLWFAGAGLLKGFATITIFGATFGVFITRQAYAAIVEILLKTE
jgi:preprotein translocase subunit SecD